MLLTTLALCYLKHHEYYFTDKLLETSIKLDNEYCYTYYVLALFALDTKDKKRLKSAIIGLERYTSAWNEFLQTEIARIKTLYENP